MCKLKFKVVKGKSKGGRPPYFVVYPKLSGQTLFRSFV
jgi:hypothetical protein